MNRKEFRKQGYMKPKIKIIATLQEHLLQVVSGQHNPGHHGTGPSSAKQGMFEEDEEDETFLDTSEEGASNWGIENY